MSDDSAPNGANGNGRNGFSGLADRWLDGLLGKGVRTIVVPALLTGLLTYNLNLHGRDAPAPQIDTNIYQKIGQLETAVGDVKEAMSALKASFDKFSTGVDDHYDKIDHELERFHRKTDEIDGKLTELEGRGVGVTVPLLAPPRH